MSEVQDNVYQAVRRLHPPDLVPYTFAVELRRAQRGNGLASRLGYLSMHHVAPLELLPDMEWAELERGSFGYSVPQSAADSHWSPDSIKLQRKRLFAHLGARNMAHATRIGFEKHLLSPRIDIASANLTTGEIQYLTHISYGDTEAQVASRMGLDESANRKYRRSIGRKFGTTSPAHLVRLGFETGLLVPSEAAQSHPDLKAA